jgi:cell division protein ZapB
MISEFQALSDKISLLAELTASLRRENAHLRQSNALLSADNLAFQERLSQAQQRVEALMASIPAPEDERDPVNDDEAVQ